MLQRIKLQGFNPDLRWKMQVAKTECVVDLFRLGKRKQIATDRLLAIQTDKQSLIILFLGLKILHCLSELMCCRCYRSKYYYLFLTFARYYFMN